MTHLLFKPKKTLITLTAGVMAVGMPTAGFITAAIFAPAAPALAQSNDLDRAVTALRGIATMKADFTQTDRQGQSIKGVMTLKRPGKIRFEYAKGTDLLVVSNGKSLYLVDYAVNQVQRWPIQSSPLGALLDPSRDVKKFGKLAPTGNSGVISIEVRDPKRPEFGVITMIFVKDASAPGGLQLTHWVALDSQNHRTTVRLKNHRYGIPIADSAFKFKDPRKTTRRPR